MPREKGSGEAIQSWNRDQISARPAMIQLMGPTGSLAPTSWAISSSAESASCCCVCCIV